VVKQLRNTKSLPHEITITENKESEFDRNLRGLLKAPPLKKDK
jgi:hypothetical protein